jgi:transketolase
MNKRINDMGDIKKLTADTIRLLAADGVQKANSGHPGMPMGMADSAAVLWTKIMIYNPRDPLWMNRDRFILSAGHGSMLIYSMLYLSGYDVTMDDLKSFRQWGSRTPGHPEYGHLPGIETTTGPLGQGFSNGVGMAIAAKMTAARFNTEKHRLFGLHNVFGIVSDGDLMEGVSAEAASLAGHLGLGNLIYLYDDNNITIEGKTNLTFTEDVAARFKAYNWQVLDVDGHHQTQIEEEIKKGLAEKSKPTLIITKTHIGHGSPNKHDTSGVHGSPLGEDELKVTKKTLGFDEEQSFYVPEKVKDVFAKRTRELKIEYDNWQKEFADWKNENPELDTLRKKMYSREIPEDFEGQLLESLPEKETATRNYSGIVMQKIAELVPGLVGGSADLDPSTKTFLKDYPAVQSNQYDGRNFHFGIREHAMCAINNGIVLYGGFIPYGSTFLVFSDYMRPSLRLAALMGIQNINVFTHDSIYVGEDGPTHQPVEQVNALRIIPNMTVLRPADGYETALCWAIALRNQKGPTSLVLTRQNAPSLDRPVDFDTGAVAKGAYVISKESNGPVRVAILASGSEVLNSIKAKEMLETKGISTRVVSVPGKNIFDQQDVKYRREILPEELEALIVVEAGTGVGWNSYFNLPMLHLTIERFGASAPYKILEEKYGFTAEQLSEKIEGFLVQDK